MSTDPSLVTFYKNRVASFQEKLEEVKQSLFASSMLRLFVFCVFVVGTFALSGAPKWVAIIPLGGIALFLYLLSRHTDLRLKRDTLQELVTINETEIKVLARDFHDRPDGSEYKHPLHYYSQDVDLFGKGSFYQYLDRTALQHGNDTLATLLLENAITDIPKKQEAIRELAEKPDWRQHFTAIAKLVKTETTTEVIVGWMADYTPFVPKLMKWVPLAFSGISITVLIAYFFGFVHGLLPIAWIFLGLGLSGVYLKRIRNLAGQASKIQSTFRQYHKLLVLIENETFVSQKLEEMRQTVLLQKGKTSTFLRQFAKLLGGLDSNNNVFYLIFGNGYFLGGLSYAFRVEQWIRDHGPEVSKWFDVVAFFDAHNTLGNFTYNHPTYTFPEIVEADIVLDAKQVAHPLLDPSKSVKNDFLIDNEAFFIVTGANMAGKSTFLRTVSLHIVMANMGLPVCAETARYAPIKLITSMRTTDSLTDDESYFFSELKRLRFVVDNIQQDRYFIVLDEILKGTNSIDKAKGSRQFVERLVGSGATGIIATHDLSLCEASEKWPRIQNYYFDAEIVDGELFFDYTLKQGICQNMNASFLLKKMGIVG
ncbi:MutS-related protein [Maribacter sp. 2-571]|uniref:MutS-related protein n=1 Tax=Maribacter sp. 2-571 TaxID=3417569 RepID=UPI003D352538